MSVSYKLVVHFNSGRTVIFDNVVDFKHFSDGGLTF